jgi:hypothetical protein
VGLRIVPADGVRDLVDGTVLVQPCVDFAYEVSFYFVDHTFQYALRTVPTD